MGLSKISSLLKKPPNNESVNIKGWVKNKRGSKNVTFIKLNDGSSIKNIQIVIENNNFDFELIKKITTGSCISTEGKLVKSEGSEQSLEVIAVDIEILGEASAEKYPLQPKKHSLEFLRENSHLRFRSSIMSSVFRIRHALTFAIHKYFHENGFYNIHTPIITGADAEGAGDMFCVTSFDFDNLPKDGRGKVDFSKDFFGRKTHLTVSGQLEAELGALGMGKVYTFGPTFRAENSNTSRHLSEFWMIEPEVAFADLNENMELAESFLKFCIQFCIENYKDDLLFLNNWHESAEKNIKKELRSDMSLLDRLTLVLNANFEKLTYTEAINILKSSKPNRKKRFDYTISGFGDDLQSEHERFLVETVFKKPIIITDYPKEIKAFYMRMNDDEKTVRAMDVLFPSIGEIIGGSQREERLAFLEKRMVEMSIHKPDLWWYLETRRFGSCIHSGFGLGFERLVMFLTGMKNIRDVIPFARAPQNAEF